MFANLYTKRIRASLRNWETLLWTWIFPLMMATLFYFAFSKLDKTDLFTSIPAGIVADDEYQSDEIFHTVLEAVSGDSETALLNPSFYSSVEEAKKALEAQEIDGYIALENGLPRLFVARSGINQTILKSFLEQYSQARNAIVSLLEQAPQDPERLLALFDTASFTKEISLSKNKPSEIVGYFYALLAMVCMYGAFQGLESVSYLQANLSPLGARRTLAPAKRFTVVLADLLAALTIHLVFLMCVLYYVIFILGINFGPNLLPVIAVCIVGSLLGISFGALLTAASRLKEGIKISLIITISLVCCYGAGLMVTGINYTIAKYAPVLAWINPAARIADAFYCLYYYDGYSLFFLNLAVLAVMTIVMLAATIFFLRRQRYESI